MEVEQEAAEKEEELDEEREEDTEAVLAVDEIPYDGWI